MINNLKRAVDGQKIPSRFILMYRKIKTIIGVSIGNSLIYRGSFFLRLIILSISLTTQFFFWNVAFSDRGEIVNYSFNGFFSYLLIANLIYELLIPNNVMISDQIREGNLTHFLLLPYSFLSLIFWKLVGDRISYFMISLVPIFGSLALFKIFGEIDIKITLLGNIFLGLYIIGGMILHFLIDFGIGQLAFWFQKSDFLLIVKEISLRILAGLWFPFQILPLTLQKVFGWAPFQFLGYVPAQAFLKPYTISWTTPCLLLSWILLLYILNFFLWKLGNKRYEAFGG